MCRSAGAYKFAFKEFYIVPIKIDVTFEVAYLLSSVTFNWKQSKTWDLFYYT